MPKFKVTKCVDAFVHYQTTIEARDASEARRMAQEVDEALEWEMQDVSEYDHVDYDNIPPELIATTGA